MTKNNGSYIYLYRFLYVGQIKDSSQQLYISYIAFPFHCWYKVRELMDDI